MTPLYRGTWLDGIIVVILVSLTGSASRTIFQPIIQWALEKMPGGSTIMNDLLITQIIQTFLVLLFVWLFLYKVRKYTFHTIGIHMPAYWWFLIAIACGFGLCLLMLGLAQLISIVFPEHIEPQAITNIIVTANTPWECLVPIIVTGILAPFSEEILFRGFMFHSMQAYCSPLIAIVATAMIFGCMHMDLTRAIPLSIASVLLSLLYMKSKSLFVPMIAHGTWNIIMTISVYTA